MAGLLTSSLEVTSGLPSLFVPVKVNVPVPVNVPVLINRPVTIADVLKKGLTASGNVADSHCIPILAPVSLDQHLSVPRRTKCGCKVTSNNSNNQIFSIINQ